MAGYRDFGIRLAAMGGMRRITTTMKLVSAAHLHRAQVALHAAEPYARALHATAVLLRRPAFAGHRLVAPAGQPDRVLLLVLSSNRGLCGAFNLNLARAVRRWLAKMRGQTNVLRASFYGRKGYNLLQHDVESHSAPQPMSDHPGVEDAGRILRACARDFLDGRFAEVYLSGNDYRSSAVQVPVVRRLLPLTLPTESDADEPPELLEPGAQAVFERAALMWAELQLVTALLHSSAGEHAARVLAMENASSNLRSLESELTLLRNRARQAAITTELGEVVGGAEALA
ncbi:MAG: F0F1 ATP synthase subunit gamma [Kiritimatiellae bacterium]|nr:F0F1 ATP synthase subunit gamma [Kiritimatiellia bacterium]